MVDRTRRKVDRTLCRMMLSGFRSIALQEVIFSNQERGAGNQERGAGNQKRGAGNQELDVSNPIFVVGRNGSGKSNFVDAFAFLSEAMASPLQAVVEQRGGFSAVSRRDSARGGLADVTLSVELQKPDRDTAVARYYVNLRPRRRYHFEVATESCFVERNDGQNDSFRRLTDRGSTDWNSTVESLVPDVEPNALALPLVGGDSRFRPVLRFLAGMRTYRIEPAALRAMQDPDGGVGLRADGGNAASVLRKIRRRSPEDWKRICELLESVVPGTVGVRSKKHGNKLTLEFTQIGTGAEPIKFEAFSMSDGTLRVLGLITAVFQRPAPSLLVIEEPEASIHPGALGSILDVLKLASRSMQVVVTTHSPDVLDAKWIEARHLRILSWEHGRTRIGRVSQTVRTALRKHLMGAGELLRSNALTAEDETDGNPDDPTRPEDGTA